MNRATLHWSDCWAYEVEGYVKVSFKGQPCIVLFFSDWVRVREAWDNAVSILARDHGLLNTDSLVYVTVDAEGFRRVTVPERRTFLGKLWRWICCGHDNP